MGRKVIPALAFAVVGMVTLVAVNPADASPGGPQQAGPYVVAGVRDVADRNRIGGTGAAIDSVENGRANITATPGEAQRIERLGYRVTRAQTEGFPAADAGYHDYAEMMADLDRTAKAHPAIMEKLSIGKSYEGRDMPLIKISDNVAKDENEPEVLFDAHQHAREHLTVEMALYLIHLFTDNYGKDPRITKIVNSREIWIVPDMNPDGGVYDLKGGQYQNWRKNRQPVGGGNFGVDLNRNWAYQFGCCQGASKVSGSETYHGPVPFSAPETANLRDFVLSRRIGGTQQIRTAIDFHTYSELILWPYGYTNAPTTGDLNADQERTFSALGHLFAKSNGYTPEQSSGLYISSGSVIDWLWGSQGVFAYTFEMYPGSPEQGGFYPSAKVISAQTARNKESSLLLAEYADCAYRVIGKQQQYC